VEHHGAVPEQHEEGKSQRHGRNGKMDQSRGGRVAEVDRSQLEEVDDQNYLRPDRVRADPEHDPGEVEDVEPVRLVAVLQQRVDNIQDEVASDRGGRVDGRLIAAEQVPDVDQLQEPKRNPVDADKDVAQGERGDVGVALAEDGVVVLAIFGGVAGVVERGNELQQERQKSQDPVAGDVAASALDIAGKGVGCERSVLAACSADVSSGHTESHDVVLLCWRWSVVDPTISVGG
jgi:hypothetical protein